jgi:hypothetical protein
MRVHLGLAVVESNVTDQRDQFHLFVQHNGADIFSLPS